MVIFSEDCRIKLKGLLSESIDTRTKDYSSNLAINVETKWYAERDSGKWGWMERFGDSI